MTYDLGVNYKTAFNKTPVTLTAMCYNLTDKTTGLPMVII